MALNLINKKNSRRDSNGSSKKILLGFERRTSRAASCGGREKEILSFIWHGVRHRADKQLHSGEEDLRGARKPKVLGKPDVGNLALGNACLQEGKK